MATWTCVALCLCQCVRFCLHFRKDKRKSQGEFCKWFVVLVFTVVLYFASTFVCVVCSFSAISFNSSTHLIHLLWMWHQALAFSCFHAGAPEQVVQGIMFFNMFLGNPCYSSLYIFELLVFW